MKTSSMAFVPKFIMRSEVTLRYIEAVEAIRALADAEGLDEATRAYAEVAQPLRREEWMRQNGLTAEGGPKKFTEFILRRPWTVEREISINWPEGCDHSTLWLKNGQPVLYTSEPYQLTDRELEDHLRFAKEHDLELFISAQYSMWFPGQTMLVEFRRKEETRKAVLSGGSGDNTAREDGVNSPERKTVHEPS